MAHRSDRRKQYNYSYSLRVARHTHLKIWVAAWHWQTVTFSVVPSKFRISVFPTFFRYCLAHVVMFTNISPAGKHTNYTHCFGAINKNAEKHGNCAAKRESCLKRSQVWYQRNPNEDLERGQSYPNGHSGFQRTGALTLGHFFRQAVPRIWKRGWQRHTYFVWTESLKFRSRWSTISLYSGR